MDETRDQLREHMRNRLQGNPDLSDGSYQVGHQPEPQQTLNALLEENRLQTELLREIIDKLDAE